MHLMDLRSELYSDVVAVLNLSEKHTTLGSDGRVLTATTAGVCEQLEANRRLDHVPRAPCKQHGPLLLTVPILFRCQTRQRVSLDNKLFLVADRELG